MSELQTTQQRMLTMRDLLKRSEAQFAAALPKHLSVERLMRVALTAIRSNPRLLECDPQTVLGSLMIAAQLGLEPDGVTGLGYLIPRRNRKRSERAGHEVVECNFQPGYKGLAKLAHNSGLIAGMRMDVVREGDHYEVEKGLNERLVHRPARDNFNARITDVYAIVRDCNGGTYWDSWPAERVEMHRQRYSKDTREDAVWATNWDVMACKTLLTAALKLAPKSVEVERAIAAQERSDAELGQDGLYGVSAADLASEPQSSGAAPQLPQAAAPLAQAAERVRSRVGKPKEPQAAEAQMSIVDRLASEAQRIGPDAFRAIVEAAGGDAFAPGYGLAESVQRSVLDAAMKVST